MSTSESKSNSSIPDKTNKDNKDNKEKDADELKIEFAKRIEKYLEGGNPSLRVDGKTKEFELRFGINTKNGGGRPISKLDYDNVVKQIMSQGFSTKNADGLEMLRIYSEYTDKQTGQVRVSNIRAELLGVDMIQEYCKSNSLDKIALNSLKHTNKVKFTKKVSPKGEDGRFQRPIDFNDMNFRVAYQFEQDFNITSPFINNIVSKWTDNKKNFRNINRVRFEHPELPVFVDISIIRTNKKSNKVPILTYTIQDSKVFENTPSYEIELELDNSRVGMGTNYESGEQIMGALRKCIRMILSGIQGSNYPIPFSERNHVYTSYMTMLHGKDAADGFKRISPANFIGPDSYTLQLENIVSDNSDTNVPNIRQDYSVTDKADGDRKMLFVNEEGRIYYIDKNMNITFTGCKTAEKTIFMSLIDGEHIKYDKTRNFINLYAAFDIYFVGNKNVRTKSFMYDSLDKEEGENEDGNQKEKFSINDYRLPLLNKFVSLLKPSSILKENNIRWKEITDPKTGLTKKWVNRDTFKSVMTKPEANPACGLRVECKKFYFTSPQTTIFEGCSEIISSVKDGLVEYITDGLIFTPSKTGVASNKKGEAGPLEKSTWDMSFKWKPVESNTVDFLVSVEKDKSGRDKISNVFQEGTSTNNSDAIIQYKTLVLMCGFDPKKHGYENPYNDILHENLPSPSLKDENTNTYEPAQFRPTSPYDENAGLCNIMLKCDGENMLMMTEEGEYFEESNIVEFRYDKSKDSKWRWIPIRVRYDKTQKLLAGSREYGNAYHVANSNWHSIHNEITEDMIVSGNNIPDVANIGEGDVYYNQCHSDESKTIALRNFHNLFVKKKLITGVANAEDTLIDYAVGRGGDIAKWKSSKLSFVLGIDLYGENIMNPIDGACVRYLNECKKTSKLFYAVFMQGNTGLNIRNGKCFTSEKDKMVINALIGKGSKDATVLGKGVYKRYGVGESGFNISSCQFALHYYFENPLILHGFMQNIAENTKIQGYFISTCFDGKSVFDLLRDKEKGESYSFMTDPKYGPTKKICEIIKKYDESGFPDDENSIGYAIDVYQESINKVCREYLVNFEYFVRIMEDYGFTLITNDEAKQMGMPRNSGLFGELFAELENDVKMNPKLKKDFKQAIHMTSVEKNLSFMNRYCIFKKTTTVPAAKIAKLLLNAKKNSSMFDTDYDEDSELAEALETEQRLQSPIKGNITKLKAKIVLKPINENLDILSDSESSDDEFEPKESTRKIQTEKETEKDAEKEADKETEKETEKDADKETEKETDKETDKETEKDAEKETEKETETPVKTKTAKAKPPSKSKKPTKK